MFEAMAGFIRLPFVMFQLPMAMLAGGLRVMAAVASQFQNAIDARRGQVGGAASKPAVPAPNVNTEKEKRPMADMLTSDDTMCFVEFQIYDLKAGLEDPEKILVKEGKELVNWATTESELKTYLVFKYAEGKRAKDIRDYDVNVDIKKTFTKRKDTENYAKKQADALEEIQKEVKKIADKP